MLPGHWAAILRGKAARRHTLTILFDKLANPVSKIEVCDLADETSIVRATHAIQFESCDYWRLLVASGSYIGTNAELTWDMVRESIEINLMGVSHFVFTVIEGIRKARKKCRIVVVTSAAARVGSRDIGYGVAKSGLEGLIRSVSKAYARNGITVIGINPGAFASRMSANQHPDRLSEAIGAGHIGRIITVHEVSKCVDFALYAAPDALTGTFISPSAGQISS